MHTTLHQVLTRKRKRDQPHTQENLDFQIKDSSQEDNKQHEGDRRQKSHR